MEYEADLESNLIKLCINLNTGAYIHGGYDHKILSDKKRRDIAVATVQDRIVHRLLYDHLVKQFDKRFDPDVWSGRKNKGLHTSLKRIAHLVDKYPDCYVWRADIEKFFDNVDHQILKGCLVKHIDDETVQKLLDKVIDSYVHNKKSVSQSVEAWHSNWQFDQSNISERVPQRIRQICSTSTKAPRICSLR